MGPVLHILLWISAMLVRVDIWHFATLMLVSEIEMICQGDFALLHNASLGVVQVSDDRPSDQIRFKEKSISRWTIPFSGGIYLQRFHLITDGFIWLSSANGNGKVPRRGQWSPAVQCMGSVSRQVKSPTNGLYSLRTRGLHKEGWVKLTENHNGLELDHHHDYDKLINWYWWSSSSSWLIFMMMILMIDTRWRWLATTRSINVASGLPSSGQRTGLSHHHHFFLIVITSLGESSGWYTFNG